jgi:F-type H+-transporting ATPase subunit b
MISLAFAENSIQLVPDGTLIFHVVIILVMVFVLNATLFKPINRILEEREKRTRGRSTEAQNILHRVEQKISHYEHSLREARAEGYRLMEKQRTEAMSERQAKLNVVREEMNQLIAEQKNIIRAQMEEARTTLASDSRRIAAEIGAQILQRPISDGVVTSVNLSA